MAESIESLNLETSSEISIRTIEGKEYRVYAHSVKVVKSGARCYLIVPDVKMVTLLQEYEVEKL